MQVPPVLDDRSLEEERVAAIALFRVERLDEPVDAYHELFDTYRGIVEEFLEATVDLTRLDENALSIMSADALQEAFRYLAGPPISEADLQTLAEAGSLRPSRLQKDPEMLRRIISVVRAALDRRRFAWVAEGRAPTGGERHAAVVASAALMATQRLQTDRRTGLKDAQEQRVEETLLEAGLNRVPTRRIRTLADAPAAGEFCRESHFGGRKADFVIGLWDGRKMPLECKVSNSATNSVKRLNNDAAVKAEVWRQDFGNRQVVPAAVLGGVYKLHNLRDAQERGLSLFWAHNLSALTGWIARTCAPP